MQEDAEPYLQMTNALLYPSSLHSPALPRESTVLMSENLLLLDEPQTEYQKLIRQAQSYISRRRKRASLIFVTIILLCVVFGFIQYLYYLRLSSSSHRAEDIKLLATHRQRWWQLVFWKWMEVDTSLSGMSDTNHQFVQESTSERMGEVDSNSPCMNTAQGKDYVVDHRGYMCRRWEMDREQIGCCNATVSSRYQCNACVSGCCPSFEECVSCCLGDETVAENFARLLSQQPNAGGKPLSAPLHQIGGDSEKRFEMCMAFCRTSSQSVNRDNSFKSPSSSRYCFLHRRPTST